ncbi:MAG: DUF1499 domain-containing protein [Paracoccaceae bacterium]|nr:DUF1499 domain-containing protein [Paracoccaceae bacterium]
MKALAIGILVAIAMIFFAGSAFVRISPIQPVEWHIDPLAAEDPGQKGIKIALRSSLPPEDALEKLNGIILASDDTEYLDGHLDELRFSYVSRSDVMGFPDVTTIQAYPGDDATTIVFLGRLRFGNNDLGTNRIRVLHWINTFQNTQD